MANVLKNKWNSFWPVGLVTVAASGTAVGLMSVVDSGNVNAPGTATPATNSALNPSSTSDELTVTCQQIIFRAVKSVAPVVENTGAVYILIKGGASTVNKSDSGSLLMVLQPGQSFTLGSAALNRNVFSPYDILVDADNNNDGVIATLMVQ